MHLKICKTLYKILEGTHIIKPVTKKYMILTSFIHGRLLTDSPFPLQESLSFEAYFMVNLGDKSLYPPVQFFVGHGSLILNNN